MDRISLFLSLPHREQKLGKDFLGDFSLPFSSLTKNPRKYWKLKLPKLMPGPAIIKQYHDVLEALEHL